MFMTLIGELSWQRLRRSVVDFYSKHEKIALWATFRALRGNVRTPSMARWKARGRLYIRRNSTFFAISYGWDVMSGNRSKSAFFEGGGSLWAQISEGREHRPSTTVGVRVAEWLPFSGIKISTVRHLVLSQSTRVADGRTDGRTDRQNYDSQDRPRICSRGNKELKLAVTESLRRRTNIRINITGLTQWWGR